jgi:hypothetical protein
MVTTQGNSPSSYLYLKPAKASYFSFLSFVFSCTKSENRRLGTDSVEEGELVLVQGKMTGKKVEE